MWGKPCCVASNHLWLAIAWLLLTPLGSHAAGVVDPGFTLPAAYQGSSQLAVRALPGGKTMLVTQGTVTRLNENGSEDGSYQVAQVASANAQAAAVLPDGRVILAGRSPLTINGTPYGSVVRLLANGGVDPGFESLAGNTFIAFSGVQVDREDRVYLTLQSLFNNMLGGQSVGQLVRLRADGTLDNEWQPALGSSFNPSIALFPNDDLLLARSSNLEIVRLSPAGQVVPGFASRISPLAGNNSFSLVDPAQRPVMGSLFINNVAAYTNSLVRLLPNGVIDPGFISRAVADTGYQVFAVDRFGRYYTGGGFSSYGGVARARLLRLFPDGALDESFVADCNGDVNRLAFAADGRLMVGGHFNQINGANAPRLARLLVDDLSEAPRFQMVNTNFHDFDSAGLVSLPVMRVGPTNEAASVSFATSAGTALPATDYLEVSGTLVFAPGEDLKHIEIALLRNMAIDPTRDFFVSLSNPSAGTTLSARATARVTLIESDSEVFFETATETLVEGSAVKSLRMFRNGTGSVADLRLSAQDGTAVKGVDYDLPTTLVQFKEGESERSFQIQLMDDAVEMPDRDFTVMVASAEGATVISPDALHVTITDNDADGWPGLALGWAGLSVSGVFAVHQDAEGRILVGGGFNQVNGVTAHNLVRMLPGGNLDPAFQPGTGPNAAVRVILEDGQGRLLLGGDFTSYNGLPADRIARLLPDGSLDPLFDSSPGFSSFVESIQFMDGGRILAGGLFKTYNGVTRTCVAILREDGSLDETFVPAPAVPAFEYFGHGAFQSPDGIIVIGEAGNHPTNAVFRLLPSGQRDPSFVTTVTRDVGAAGVTDAIVQPDGRIVICGIFNSVNGVPRNHVARLLPDGGLDESFDPGAGADQWVFKMRRQSDGRLLLVGHFLSYDGQLRPYAVRIHPDGSLDDTFDLGTGPDSSVNAAWVGSDDSVLLGGRFQRVGDISRPAWASIGPDGRLALTVPRFLNARGENGALALELEVEPGFDVRLLESTNLDGWSPVATDRTVKRVLRFESELAPTGNRFFQAERLGPQ